MPEQWDDQAGPPAHPDLNQAHRPAAPPTTRDTFVPPREPGQGFGIASLVLGIMSLVLFLQCCLCTPLTVVSPVLGVPAIVFGACDWNISQKHGFPKRGMATAGFVCGVISVTLFLLLAVLFIVSLFDSGNSSFHFNFGP